MEPKVPPDNVNNVNISLAWLHTLVHECCSSETQFPSESRYRIDIAARRSRHHGNASGPTGSGQELEIEDEEVSVRYGCSHRVRCTCGGRRPRCASLHQGARRRRSPPCTTGAVSTSAPTAAGVRAASAGTSTRRRRLAIAAPKVAMMRPAARPVVRSAIAGRPAAGCSASKPRATGPTSRAAM